MVKPRYILRVRVLVVAIENYSVASLHRVGWWLVSAQGGVWCNGAESWLDSWGFMHSIHHSWSYVLENLLEPAYPQERFRCWGQIPHYSCRRPGGRHDVRTEGWRPWHVAAWRNNMLETTDKASVWLRVRIMAFAQALTWLCMNDVTITISCRRAAQQWGQEKLQGY